MHVVHERRFICVLGFLLGRQFSFACEKRSSQLRIIDQELPFEMAALPVVQVAGFTGVKVSCGITIDLGVDLTVLEVGVRVAFFAAVVIGGRNIVNASSGLQ